MATAPSIKSRQALSYSPPDTNYPAIGDMPFPVRKTQPELLNVLMWRTGSLIG